MEQSQRAGEQASAARRVHSNRFGVLSSDDEDDESDEDGGSERSCMAVKGASYKDAEARGRAAVEKTAAPKAHPKGRGEPTLSIKNPAQPSASEGAVAAASPALSQAKARSVTRLDAALADDAWGWDTMASSCCSGNRARFISLRKCPAVPVKWQEAASSCDAHRERARFV